MSTSDFCVLIYNVPGAQCLRMVGRTTHYVLNGLNSRLFLKQVHGRRLTPQSYSYWMDMAPTSRRSYDNLQSSMAFIYSAYHPTPPIASNLSMLASLALFRPHGKTAATSTTSIPAAMKWSGRTLSGSTWQCATRRSHRTSSRKRGRSAVSLPAPLALTSSLRRTTLRAATPPYQLMSLILSPQATPSSSTIPSPVMRHQISTREHCQLWTTVY